IRFVIGVHLSTPHLWLEVLRTTSSFYCSSYQLCTQMCSTTNIKNDSGVYEMSALGFTPLDCSGCKGFLFCMSWIILTLCTV
ncbi:hypothetical protein FKM82_013007, partial [Ascaphus truei]